MVHGGRCGSKMCVLPVWYREMMHIQSDYINLVVGDISSGVFVFVPLPGVRRDTLSFHITKSNAARFRRFKSIVPAACLASRTPVQQYSALLAEQWQEQTEYDRRCA